MSVYNEENTVENAILSILKQTYSFWELIVVDDCSADNTRNIIEKYCIIDKRVKLIQNKKNRGLAYSLNKAIYHSKGQFIARMDGDDFSLPQRFEEQVKFLNENENIMVLGSSAFYSSKHGFSGKKINVPKCHKKIMRCIFKKNPFIHPSVMVRREFYLKTGGYDIKMRRAQDYDLWLRGRFVGQYHNLQTPLLVYNFQRKSSIRNIIDVLQIKLKNSSRVYDIFKSFIWSGFEVGAHIMYVFKGH